MYRRNVIILVLCSALGAFACVATAAGQSIDLTNARLIAPTTASGETREIISAFMNAGLRERTGLSWKLASSAKHAVGHVIVFSLADDGSSTQRRKLSTDREKYSITTEEGQGRTMITITGSTKTALLYGGGHLLRQLHHTDGRLILPQGLNHESSPVYPIRGHQIGYRNKANSYDAWSVDQYERYIRELVIFGTNAIENIPMDDNEENDHMQVSRQEMNASLSDICHSYGIQYWLWTPITVDISKETAFVEQLGRHEALYRDTPMISEVFVPGGDPGNNHPRDVLPFVRSLDSLLHMYHPGAGVWLSLQRFDEEEVDYFYAYLAEHQPDWLRGVVSGPSSPPIAETRHRLSDKYRHRLYPDITHTVRCEYPPKNLDQAFALTLGREGINPLPYHHAAIQREYGPFSDGCVSYSDGCHDDVNKVIWSMLGWDPNYSIPAILEQYCNYHFGAGIAKQAAEGIAAIEHNMDGPLFSNVNVELTFRHWQDMESSYPGLAGSWRWQMLILRAYYDVYTRRRLLYEQRLEEDAYDLLKEADTSNVQKKMSAALIMTQKADTDPIAAPIRARIVQLCDALFKSIGLQTSVQKYRAENTQRGCILDFVDYPLNNRWWLEDEFSKIRKMDDPASQLKRLEVLRTWESPGPGSYYDNISNIAQSPHVKTTVYDAVDFAWWDSGYSRARLSSQVFQNNPILEYENLDPNGRYIIRLAGYGDALIRVDGQRLKPEMYNKEPGTFKQFVVPRTAAGDGYIKVTFDLPEESHLRWSKYSRISDVWLIKK